MTDADGYRRALKHVVERDPALGADLKIAHLQRRAFIARRKLARPSNVADAFVLGMHEGDTEQLDTRLVEAVRAYAADPTAREPVEDAIRRCLAHYRAEAA